MHFSEFDAGNQQLVEIKMKPMRLAAQANRINALVGMEFEMIVPVEQDELTFNSEPDYSENQNAESFDNIKDFFQTNNANTQQAINQAIAGLQEEQLEWAQEQVEKQWKLSGYEFYLDFFQEELWDRQKYSDAIKQRALELSNDPQSPSTKTEIDGTWNSMIQGHYNFNEYYDQLLIRAEDELVKTMGKIAWSKQIQLDQVKDQYSDMHIGRYLNDDWLGGITMRDISDNYNLDWPYWLDSQIDFDLDGISKSFSQGIGKPVTVGYWHGTTPRRAGHYVIEPDSTIETETDSDQGLEFVSHPMPLQEMLEDLANVISWAQEISAYTNDSCGLHMNISIPKANLNNLDYVKLAVLLGDEYILKQFDRLYNTYAQSALRTIRTIAKSIARGLSNERLELLDKLRSNFDTSASRIIYGTYTIRHSSIGVRINDDTDWRIEFRSPGNDWLNTPIEQLTQALFRFIVVLEAALDPNKYRKEYLTKLYKLLDVREEPDIIEYFVKYTSGIWSKEDLIKQLRDRWK